MDIRTYRTEHRLTQADFAALLSAIGESASQGLVSQWENGEQPITAERAVQIERATGGEVARSNLRPDLWPADAAA